MTPLDKIATISEDLCIGCGICVKKCPFDAIQIINLPANLEKETTHRKVVMTTVLGGAATCPEGFVKCFLKIRLACFWAAWQLRYNPTAYGTLR